MEIKNTNDNNPDDSPSGSTGERGRFDLLYKILKVSDESVKTTARLESAVDKIGQVFTIDSHAPAAIAAKAEAAGMTKAKLSTLTTILLGIMAGLFIGFGAVICTVVTTGSGAGFGLTKLIGGLSFCLGLILVVIAGAELFTGNNLIVIGWLSGKVKFTELLRNWGLVYTSNLIGSLILVGLVFSTNQWTFNGYGVGVNALNIANAKVNLSFGDALARGILCNALVCLAVWLCFSARTVMDKIIAIIFPITAFVAAGFEHSIANMYFIPMGMLLAKQQAVLTAAGLTVDSVANLTWSGFLGNLVPVTIGNIIGGVSVGVIYWLAYLRTDRASETVAVRPWLKTILPSFGDVRPQGSTVVPVSPVNVQIEDLIRAKLGETDNLNLGTREMPVSEANGSRKEVAQAGRRS
ncbi:MAG: formate/nitrite transporter family protein [Dehalococcoidales bacterium]|nr:formate/nitrite transporter family protein [Dehalococcoidales bacterium]